MIKSHIKPYSARLLTKSLTEAIAFAVRHRSRYYATVDMDTLPDGSYFVTAHWNAP